MACRRYHSNDVLHDSSVLMQHVYHKTQECNELVRAMNRVVNVESAQRSSRKKLKRITNVVTDMAIERSKKVSKNGTTYYGNGFRVMKGWGGCQTNVILMRQLVFTENRRQPGVTVSSNAPITFPKELDQLAFKVVSMYSLTCYIVKRIFMRLVISL